jgi:hypothetical protein
MHKTVILLAFVGALLLGGKAMAASVTLGWNPSSSGTGVNGYYIYYGTSTNNFITVPVYGTNVTISGLVTGQTYYFAAASFASAGNNWSQSTLSPIISATIGSLAPAGGALSALTGLPAGQFGFTLSGAANTQYIVEGSTDLVNWVALQTNTGSFQFVDSNTAQYPRRFYRTVSTSN